MKKGSLLAWIGGGMAAGFTAWGLVQGLGSATSGGKEIIPAPGEPNAALWLVVFVLCGAFCGLVGWVMLES